MTGATAVESMRAWIDRATRMLDGLPPVVVPVAIFLASIALQYTRRPDIFATPQFFAEDGIFYMQAHNLGALAPLFVQSNGYLQLLPRLVAAVAQAVPLAWGPAVLLVAGAVVDALPAAFVASSRMRAAIPSVWARLLLGALYIAMPGGTTLGSVLVYSQWNLSVLAFLILVAEPAKTRIGGIVDAAVVALSGLSGPYSILLAPVAALHWWRRRSRRSLALAIVVGVLGAVQALTVFTSPPGTRSTAPLGATPFLFFQIVGRRLFYGPIVGHTLQTDPSPALQGTIGNPIVIAVVAVIGLSLVAVALWRGTHELRMLLLYAGAIFAGALAAATVPSDGSARWEVLTVPIVLTTYFIVPTLAVYAMCVWMLATRGPLRAVGGLILVAAAVLGIPADWRELPVEDFNFAERVRIYERASPGSLVFIPTPPRGWSIALEKPREKIALDP